MGTNKFSIIFMRDDGNVRRMRVTPLFLKTMLSIEIIILLCACVGGYCGAYFWSENQKLYAEIREYKHTIQQNNIEIDRLHTVEKLVKNNSEDVMSSLIASAQAQKKEISQKNPINLQKILHRTDKHVFDVTNVQLSIKKQDAEISFDVNKKNTDNDLLKGNVRIHIITSSGKVILVKTPHDLGFELRRMKQFRQKMRIPNPLKFDDVFAVRISIIDLSGETVFSESYPIYSIFV